MWVIFVFCCVFEVGVDFPITSFHFLFSVFFFFFFFFLAIENK